MPMVLSMRHAFYHDSILNMKQRVVALCLDGVIRSGLTLTQ